MLDGQLEYIEQETGVKIQHSRFPGMVRSHAWVFRSDRHQGLRFEQFRILLVNEASDIIDDVIEAIGERLYLSGGTETKFIAGSPIRREDRTLNKEMIVTVLTFDRWWK